MRKVSSYFQPLLCTPKPAKHLYLLKCETTGLYKIGKTTGDIRVRINKLYSNSHTFQRSIKTVKVWERCGFCEYYILKCFEKSLTNHPFYSNGHTEWFKYAGDESSLIKVVESIISSFKTNEKI